MNESDLAKEFIKRWARTTIALHTCKEAVMTELASEPATKQQAQVIYTDSLGSMEERRRIALELAIASFAVP